MKKKEWFENEKFWLNYAPVMFDEVHWAEAPEAARACCKIARLKKGSRVLDACCALGRMSVQFALCGMKVTGVDIMQPFLDSARELAESEGVTADFVNCDMRKFTPEKPFDLAVNVYNSFGYCDSIEDDTKILKQIFSALKEGGAFILECISRETAIRWFTEAEWFERSGLTVLTEFSPVGAWEALRSKWTIINKQGKRMEHVFNQRLYSAAELRHSLHDIGFSKAEVFGGYDLRPYDYNAQTMLIVAGK